MKRIGWCLLLLCSSNVFAEQIRLTTTLYEKPGSNAICELQSGTVVEALESENYWIPVVVYSVIQNLRVTEEFQVYNKTLLYNQDGNLIGKSISPFTLHRFKSVFNDTMMLAEIIGYLAEGAINPSSIPEFSLEKILAAYPKTFHYNELQHYFDSTGFKPWKSEGKFSSYLLFESRVKTRHPGPRLICIFHKDELVAVVYSRNVKVPYYESKAISSPYQIYYMIKLKEHEKSQMARIYFNDFKNLYLE